MTRPYARPMHLDFDGLYRKYDNELRQVARCLRKQYHMMQSQGYGTVFGDVEGELIYMLVRETQPEIAFEISPNAGWSTNYILAALTLNGKGILHSFEILPAVQGRPIEQVIRSNQCRQWDQQRLIVHIGDARQTVPRLNGTVSFLLLDSCHEDWFAEWYIKTVFPRVAGLVIIQDIAFTDQLEPSSEARCVWDWAGAQHIQLTLIGSVESALECTGLRAGYAERRGLRSNSILFWLPPQQWGDLPELTPSAESWIEQARIALAGGDYPAADRLLNQAVASLLRTPTRVNRHRLFLSAGQSYAHLGEIGESQRCFQRALGMVVQADRQQRLKGLTELLGLFLAHRQWRLTLQTGALMFLESGARLRLVQKVGSLLRALFKKRLKAE